MDTRSSKALAWVLACVLGVASATTFQGNFGRTGRVGRIPLPLAKRHTVELGAMVVSSPIVVNDTIFVGDALGREPQVGAGVRHQAFIQDKAHLIGKAILQSETKFGLKVGAVNLAKVERDGDHFGHGGAAGQVIDVLDRQAPGVDGLQVGAKRLGRGAQIVGEGVG